MALIACPDCGHKISDAAPACIQCGRPMTALTTAPSREVAPPRPHAPAESAYVCRRCGSEDIRKLSIVYASGVSTVTMDTTGVGYSGRHMTFVSGLSTGTAKTELSTRVERPTEKKLSRTPFLWGLGIGTAAVFMGQLASSGLIALFGLMFAAIVGGVLAVNENQENEDWNRTELPDLLERWNRSVMCMRCGAIYELEKGQ